MRMTRRDAVEGVVHQNVTRTAADLPRGSTAAPVYADGMTFDARAALLTKRAETTQRLKGLDESFADIVESVRDSNLDDEHDPEGSTVAVSRAQVASLAQEGREQLREIEAALRRLDDGAYGTCARCSGPIGDERLEARPTATLCIGCAQQENASPRR
ncbi:hypothetical protein GCM10009763_00510 [Dermacoccus profundi]